MRKNDNYEELRGRKRVLQEGIGRGVLIFQRRDFILQRLLLLRLVIDNLGLFHLLYRDEKLDIFDLSTEVQSMSRTTQCNKEREFMCCSIS